MQKKKKNFPGSSSNTGINQATHCNGKLFEEKARPGCQGPSPASFHCAPTGSLAAPRSPLAAHRSAAKLKRAFWFSLPFSCHFMQVFSTLPSHPQTSADPTCSQTRPLEAAVPELLHRRCQYVRGGVLQLFKITTFMNSEEQPCESGANNLMKLSSLILANVSISRCAICLYPQCVCSFACTRRGRGLRDDGEMRWGFWLTCSAQQRSLVVRNRLWPPFFY